MICQFSLVRSELTLWKVEHIKGECMKKCIRMEIIVFKTVIWGHKSSVLWLCFMALLMHHHDGEIRKIICFRSVAKRRPGSTGFNKFLSVLKLNG